MVEKLSANDSWYCNKCKDFVEATKKMELYSTAPFLILSLNRFKQHNTYFKEKLEDLIDFPISGLDMTKHVLAHQGQPDPLCYDLIGVINHYGSMNFGHYIAFGRNSQSGEWYEFNDSTVSEISASSVCSSAAYVLFYKRRGFCEGGKIDFKALMKVPSEGLEESDQIPQTNFVMSSSPLNVEMHEEKSA